MMRMFNSKCLMFAALFVVQMNAVVTMDGAEETEMLPELDDGGSLAILYNFVNQTENVINLQVEKLQEVMDVVQKKIMETLEAMTFLPSLMLDTVNAAQNQITTSAFNTIKSTSTNIQIIIDSALSGLENSFTYVQEQATSAINKLEICASKFDVNVFANRSLSMTNNILYECLSAELEEGQTILGDVYSQFSNTEEMIESLPSGFSSCLSNLNDVENMTMFQLLLERGLTMECLGRTVITVGRDTAKFTTSLSFDGVKFVVYINTFPTSLEKCIADKISFVVFDAAQNGIDLASCVFDITEIKKMQ